MASALLWTQRVLFVIGFVLLAFVGFEWFNSRARQAEGNRELNRILARKPAPGSAAPVAPIVPVAEGALVGRVEIPKLNLSAVVFQGVGAPILSHGVGHLDASALPGQPGNVVLAAHRDTFFRPLRNIREGDLIEVTTPSGVRTYKVDWTKIVDPDDVEVEDPTRKPSLTLITCYPFYFIGHAPRRFIVRAEELAPAQEVLRAPEVRKPEVRKPEAWATVADKRPAE